MEDRVTHLDEGSAGELRDALLRAIAVGERTVDEKEVLEMMRKDPEFARQARELITLQRSLEGFGVLQSAPPAPALEEIVVRTVRARVAAVRRMRLIRGWATAVAAAAVVGVVLWFWQPWRKEVVPQMLGGNLKVEVVENGTALRFGFGLPRTGHYIVSVLAPDGTGMGPPVRVEGSVWRPSAELVRVWPKGALVEVSAFDRGQTLDRERIAWEPKR